MLAEIVLPAGTDKVTVRDIPELFADALHPDIPEETPRQITRLQKMPTTKTNAKKWCGVGCRPFPVSLTDEDLAGLGDGVWAGLPPLSLPIAEPEWVPYLAAYQQRPPRGWKLVSMGVTPALHADIRWHSTVDKWLGIVRQAATSGQLTPRTPMTLLPQPQASGEWLLDCFVTVADLTQFAAQFDFGVSVEPEQFTVRGINGTSTMDRVSHDEHLRRLAQRQAQGRYTLEEAAMAIADDGRVRPDEMLKKLMQAVSDNKLTVQEPGHDDRWQSDQVREWHDEVHWDDMNKWLAKNEPRIYQHWQFPKPVAQSEAEQGISANAPHPLPRQRHQEQEILRVLREAGYDPMALPPRVAGKPGAKADARRSLTFSPSVFDKAWERLQKQVDIQYSR